MSNEKNKEKSKEKSKEKPKEKPKEKSKKKPNTGIMDTLPCSKPYAEDTFFGYFA